MREIRYFSIRGFRRRIEVTTDGVPFDPLKQAVLALVRCGCASASQLSSELVGPASASDAPDSPISHGMVQRCLDLCIQEGLLTFDETKFCYQLSASAGADGNEGTFAARSYAYVFWNSATESLLPVLLLGDMPRLSRDETVIDVGAHFESSPPNSALIRDRLFGLARSNKLKIYQFGSDGEPEALPTVSVESISLVQQEGLEKCDLFVPVEFLKSADGQPNIAFWQADFTTLAAPQSEYWYNGRAILESRSRETLLRLNEEWKRCQAELVHELSRSPYSPQELEEKVEGVMAASLKGARLTGPWNEELIMTGIRKALAQAEIDGVSPDPGPERFRMSAKIWADVIEEIVKRIFDQFRVTVDAPWSGYPRSREDARKAVLEYGFNVDQWSQVLQMVDPDLLSAVREKYPFAGGGRTGNKNAVPMIGEIIFLLKAAIFVNDRGRSEHVRFLKTLLATEPEFLVLLDRLNSVRRWASHVSGQGSLAPNGSGVRDYVFRVLAALSTATSSASAS